MLNTFAFVVSTLLFLHLTRICYFLLYRSFRLKVYNLPFGDIRAVAISVSKIMRAVVDSKLLVVHVDVRRRIAICHIIASIPRCATLHDFGPHYDITAGQERLLEGDPKLPIEVGVDERIER